MLYGVWCLVDRPPPVLVVSVLECLCGCLFVGVCGCVVLCACLCFRSARLPLVQSVAPFGSRHSRFSRPPSPWVLVRGGRRFIPPAASSEGPLVRVDGERALKPIGPHRQAPQTGTGTPVQTETHHPKGRCVPGGRHGPIFYFLVRLFPDPPGPTPLSPFSF